MMRLTAPYAASRAARAGVVILVTLAGCAPASTGRGHPSAPPAHMASTVEPDVLLARPDDPAVPPLTPAEGMLGRTWGHRVGMFSVVNPHADSWAIHTLGDALIDPKLMGPRALPDRFIRLLAFHTTLAGRGTPGELFVTRHYRSAFAKDEFPVDFQVTSFTLGETAPRPGSSTPCKVVGYALTAPLSDGIAEAHFAGNPLPTVSLDAAVSPPGRMGVGLICPDAADAWIGYRLAVVGDAGAVRLGTLGDAMTGRYAEEWYRFRPMTVKPGHMKHVTVEHFALWPGWARLDLWRRR